MTVTEKLGALGSWSVRLSEDAPQEVRGQLDYFGHIALIRGRVNPADHGDTLLNAARYVGVLRRRQGDLESELSGSGMVFWLGDEDDKGAVIESKLTLTAVTLAQAVQAVIDLCPAVKVGNVLANPAGTYTGTHQWVTPREALQVICDAFGVEFRVNGDASVDVGTQAQLYATTPGSIVVRRGAGSDLDLSALTGTFEPDTSVIDYSTRVVLVGQTLEDGTFATGSAELDTVPYVDLLGNPVKFVRLISESEQTEGAVGPRAQLQLNRFARVGRSLKVTAERYETDGTFRVGDNAYVYDPDTGIVSAAQEVTFRGQVLHPDVVRIAGITWPVSEDHTVAFRTQAGEWIDLTRWVVWETGDNELTLGDLPRSLLGGGGNPVLDRQTSSPLDTIAPQKPTGLTLSSFTATAADGHEAGFIVAAWNAPVLNEDGSVVTDLSHYLVAWKWTAGLQWQYATVNADDTDATLQAVVGLPFEVWVSAYDRSNNWSGWTAPETITVSADQTPPPAPADPGVGNYLGQLRITYAGVDLNADPMPADTARVDVEVAASQAGPWTVVSSLSPFVAGVAYASIDYDATGWVRLVAYDHTGNASAPSGAVSGTVSKVVSDDILDGAVGTEKLANLAVVTAKIGELDLNDAVVGHMNVGKIDGGLLNADVVIAGSLSTQPLPSGQHVSITSDAIEGWADTTRQTFRFDGVSNLLTGTLQTDLDGERRIVLGATGREGTIDFYAQDGTYSQIRAWTEGGGVEAIQFGIPWTPDTSGLWNRINYNLSSDGEYATYRSGTHEFIFDGSATQQGHDDLGNIVSGVGRFVVYETQARAQTVGESTTRFQMDKDSTIFYFDQEGRFQIDAGSTRFWYSGELRFQMDDAGTRFYYKDTTAGVPRERLRIDQLGTYVTDHGGDLRLAVDGTGTSIRHPNGAFSLLVSETDLQFWESAGTGGNPRFHVTPTDVWFEWNTSTRLLIRPASNLSGGGTSPGFQLVTPSQRGALIRAYEDAGGGNNRLEIRDTADATFLPVYASAFTQQSSGEVKTDIADLTFDPLERLRVAKVKSFRRVIPEDADGTHGPPGRIEYGWIAEEAPDEVVVRNDDGVFGLDVGSEVGLLIAAVQRLDARLTAQENGRKGAA